MKARNTPVPIVQKSVTPKKNVPKNKILKLSELEILRKIQSEQPNNETRTEPATQKIIQHPSNNTVQHKKNSKTKRVDFGKFGGAEHEYEIYFFLSRQVFSAFYILI